jgi:hypothetical protein
LQKICAICFSFIEEMNCMNRSLSRRTFLGAAAFTAIAAGTWSRSAAQQGAMRGTPHAGTPMAMGGIGAAYLRIENTGAAMDRLVSAASAVAETVEIHEMRQQGDVMMMAPLANGIEIAAGETVTLEPGGYHIMLIGLTRDLKAGEDFELTLTFEHAGEITLTVPIYVTPNAAQQDLQANPVEPVAVGDLSISNMWSRQAPATMAEASPSPAARGGFAGMAATFMIITNNGATPDRLVGATTDVATRVELDEIKVGSGGMAMVPLTDGLPIPAGETVAITPGKFHIILVGLTRDLVAGDHFDLTLSFETAGDVIVSVPVFASMVDAEAEMAKSPVPPTTVADISITGAWAGTAAASGAPAGMSTPESPAGS